MGSTLRSRRQPQKGVHVTFLQQPPTDRLAGAALKEHVTHLRRHGTSDLLEERRSAIISAAVTSKLDVRQAVAESVA